MAHVSWQATSRPLRHGEIRMSSNGKDTVETVLRDALRRMNADQAQTIRESYYRAVEGLTTLVDALKIADLEAGESNDHLLTEEHLLACAAIKAMENSRLGRIL
jgi:hypothetical protein